MATRCPHCNIAMTETESSSGKCPVCRKKFSAATAIRSTHNELGQEVGTSTAVAVTAPKKHLSFLPLFLMLLPFGLVGAIAQGALMGFRSGGSYSLGIMAGMGIGMGVIQGMGYSIGKRK